MDERVLESAFEKMGARVVTSTKMNRFRRGDFTLDIGNDRDGEYFFLAVRDPQIPAQILNIDKKDRHLVLMLGAGQERAKFLCGHDERHWFIAALPEKEKVTTVKEAKEALKPKELPPFREWYRQGEWFFVPRPEFHPPRNSAFAHNEPLVRRTSDGRGGKPHIVTEAYRHGGTSVWQHNRLAPQGWTQKEFDEWKEENPKDAKKYGPEFRSMVRDAKVYVRGEVKHPDHYTLKLGTVWCEVLMNRESESRAMSTMVFLD